MIIFDPFVGCAVGGSVCDGVGGKDAVLAEGYGSVAEAPDVGYAADVFYFDVVAGAMPERGAECVVEVVDTSADRAWVETVADYGQASTVVALEVCNCTVAVSTGIEGVAEECVIVGTVGENFDAHSFAFCECNSGVVVEFYGVARDS